MIPSYETTKRRKDDGRSRGSFHSRIGIKEVYLDNAGMEALRSCPVEVASGSFPPPHCLGQPILSNAGVENLPRNDGVDKPFVHRPLSIVHRSVNGSILIIALWALFFLSVLALAIGAYVQSRVGLAAKLLHRTKMHYLAKAGIKKAMLEIEKDKTELYDSLGEKWASGISGALFDGSFTVSIADEESKLNINKASYDALKNFLEIFGKVSSQEAEDMADSVIDWRDEDDDLRDNGAEDGYYSVRHPGYPCKNGNFEILEELLLVKGVTPEIFEKIKDKLTVYGEGAVNINTADDLILRSLGMSEDLAAKIISFRKESCIFEDAGTAASVLTEAEKLSNEEIGQLSKIFAAGLLSVRSDNFMGHSYGRLGGGTEFVSITFVFDRTQRRIRYWRES